VLWAVLDRRLGDSDGMKTRSAMNLRSLLRGIAICAAVSALPLHAAAQQMATPACPAATDVSQAEALGLWRAEFDGLKQGATLLLEKHPEFAETLRGAINRNGERAELAGDLFGGELTLEESRNGINISATWLGDVVEGSCGREIRGVWKAEGDKAVRPFVLRKQ
jgi:hypothetical protein